MTGANRRADRPTVLVAATEAAAHGSALGRQAQVLAENGIRVVGIGHGLDQHRAAPSCYEAVHDLPQPRPRSPLSLMRSVLSFRRTCRREQPELVWLHTSLAAAVGRVAVLTLPPRRRPRVAYLAYGFYFDSVNRSVRGVALRGIEWTLSMATDHLQTVSRDDYERARRMPGRTAANTELTRGLGVDLTALEKARVQRATVRRSLGLSDDDVAVFIVGSLERKNRVIDALEAVSGLNDDSRLFVLGDGPERRYLEAAAGGLPGPHPVFLGNRPDRTELLSAADLLLHTSSSEGLPSPVLEAQVMGIPVVGTRVRGSTDLLSGGAGVLCNLADVPALSDGMRQLLRSPERRRSVVAAGAQRAWQYQSDLAVVAARSIGHLLLGPRPSA